MTALVVVGTQWGEEGKGKIVGSLDRKGKCSGALPGRQ